MNAALTRVLMRIFAKGFFRMHSGLLLFFFVAVISYCFLINYAGTIPTAEITLASLVITITFITSPFMMVGAFVVWLLYAIKSWQYVAAQLQVPANQYLFYSATSFSKIRQFQSWCLVQAVIMLPALLYGVFAAAMGLLYHHYLIPVIALFYLVLLVMISAGMYVYLGNRLPDGTPVFFARSISRYWKKPFFSLFIYQLFDRLKVPFILTKTASLLSILYAVLCLPRAGLDVRALAVVALLIAMAHAFLIYQEHRFDATYLVFVRNFPYGRYRLFASLVLRYGLLLMPEIIWLLMRYPSLFSMGLIAFVIGMLLLFRSLLYCMGMNMRLYLWWVFGLFIALFWVIMAGVILPVTAFLWLVSFGLFYRYYYRQQ